MTELIESNLNDGDNNNNDGISDVCFLISNQ